MRNRQKISDSEIFGGKVRFIGDFYGEIAIVDVGNARVEVFQRFQRIPGRDRGRRRGKFEISEVRRRFPEEG